VDLVFLIAAQLVNHVVELTRDVIIVG